MLRSVYVGLSETCSLFHYCMSDACIRLFFMLFCCFSSWRSARLRREINAIQAKITALSAPPQSKQAKVVVNDGQVKAEVRVNTTSKHTTINKLSHDSGTIVILLWIMFCVCPS